MGARAWPGHGAVLLATGAATVMSGAAIAPALSGLHADLAPPGTSPGLARFALILPALVVMLSAPRVARSLAGVSPRTVIAGALCLTAAAGAGAALAQGYAGFLALRAVLGLATAAALAAATAAIARRYDGAQRVRMMSAQTGANTLAAVVFILSGGALATVDWRLACLLYLLALPVAAAAARLDWTDRSEPARGPSRGGAAPTGGPVATILAAMAAFYLLPTQVPFLPGVAAGPLQAGLVIGLGTLASAPAAMLSGRAVAALGAAGAIGTGFALIGLGAAEMALASGPAAGALAAVLIGAGFGLIVPAATVEAFARVSDAQRGALSGRIAAALCGGQVLAMVHATLAHGAAGATAPFWAVAGLVAAVGGGMAALTWRTRRRLAA
jgi:predicted MFS family arabinose efflux permease